MLRACDAVAGVVKSNDVNHGSFDHLVACHDRPRTFHRLGTLCYLQDTPRPHCDRGGSE